MPTTPPTAPVRWFAAPLLAVALTAGPVSGQTPDAPAFEAPVPAVPLVPDVAVDAGAYLAAREADGQRDYAQLVPFLTRLLEQTPDDLALREQLVIAQLSLGAVARAAELSGPLLDGVPDNAAGGLAVIAQSFADRDYAAVLDRVGAGGQGNPLLDSLVTAWAQAGEGRVSEALETLDSLSAESAAQAFAAYCRALILALVGDAEGALAILEAPDGMGAALNRRGQLAYVQLLGQVDRFDDALAVIDERFGPAPDPQVDRLRNAFEARQSLPFDLIGDPAEGMAEVYALLASVILSPQSQREALLYSQAALAINPDLSDAWIIVGQIYEELGYLALAETAYGMVDDEDSFALIAALGRAQTREAQGDTEAAVAMLQDAVARHPESRIAPQVLGDLLRRAGQHAEAIAAYDAAVAGIEADGRDVPWQLWFSRAVAHERAGMWPQAEADFRAALAVEPDQPTVLNYLGYSLVERQEKLDEALEMIERAVAGEPSSGYIVDSLGWALYRLGRYDEALPVMERAVELLPQDPVLNDHLGDVYWAVGRKREARFQWRRALSFGPHDDLDMERVRRKIEVGLDEVRADEGAPPLHPDR